MTIGIFLGLFVLVVATISLFWAEELCQGFISGLFIIFGVLMIVFAK